MGRREGPRLRARRTNSTESRQTLARDVPPSVLCDLLGISTTTAERWREHAGGTWTAYAAAAVEAGSKAGALVN